MKQLLSVIVPAYNAERYLMECLRSLHRQVYEYLEFICIDDGSTDSTAEILCDFQKRDKRFKIISTKNYGYGSACNKGLAHANGDYITFLESDDFCSDTYYSEIMSIAHSYKCDLVKSDYYNYWSLNRKEYVQVFPKSSYNKVLTPKYLLEQYNLFEKPPSIWSAIYSRELLGGVYFLETPGAAYQDTSFSVKALMNSKRAFFLKKAFVHYRQHPEQSVASSKNVLAICEEFAEIERVIPMDAKLLAAKFHRYMWNYKRLEEEGKQLFSARIAEEFASNLDLIDPRLYRVGEIDELKQFIKSTQDGREKSVIFNSTVQTG